MMFSWLKPLNKPVVAWGQQRVWIVGASSGIGAALASAMLQAGATVTVSARRVGELTQVAGAHPKAHVVAFDASDSAAWPQAMSETVQKMGGLDLIVMGAARYDPIQSWDFKAEDIDFAVKSFDLNVVSVYRGLLVVVPYFLEQGHGGIAMIASISSYTGLPKAMIYGATKAAMNNLAETLYFELAPKGLAIYLVSPGFVQTPMTSGNDFEMPGLMTPLEAARAMMVGFERGQFEIRFPRVFGGVLRFISRLPYSIRFAILHKTTKM